jgi:hypothetical protein
MYLSARNRSLVGHGSCSWELALFVYIFEIATVSVQCARFPGIIPVFDLFLINFEWYWYWYLKVVFELFDCFSQLSL